MRTWARRVLPLLMAAAVAAAPCAAPGAPPPPPPPPPPQPQPQTAQTAILPPPHRVPAQHAARGATRALLSSDLGLEHAPFCDHPDTWRRSAACWQERFQLPLRFKMPDGEVVSVEQFPSSSVYSQVHARRNPRYRSKVERLVKDRLQKFSGIRSSLDGIAVDPGDTGVTVWDGTLALARYICHFPDTVLHKRAVIELGSGTGLLGCIVSRLGAAKVLLSDLPHVLPRLEQATKVNCRGRDVHILDLEWGTPIPADLHSALQADHYLAPIHNSAAHLDAPLVVLCADLVYHPSAVSPLVTTIRHLLSLGAPNSFALVAQDPHDKEAVAQLSEALEKDFCCVDLRRMDAVSDSKDQGVVFVEEQGSMAGEGGIGDGQGERTLVEAVLAPFPDMMLCRVTLKDKQEMVEEEAKEEEEEEEEEEKR